MFLDPCPVLQFDLLGGFGRLGDLTINGGFLKDAALGNNDLLVRTAAGIRLQGLNLLHHIHAVHDTSKNDMTPIKPGCGHGSDKEL